MSFKLEMTMMKNMTTAMDVLQGQGPLEVSEYGASDLAVPLRSVVRDGALVSVNLRLVSPARVFDFPATGKVLSCDEVEAGVFRVKVQLRQFDREAWSQILLILQGDQTRVDALFDSIKGEP